FLSPQAGTSPPVSATINTTLYMFASASGRNPFRNRPRALRTLARPTPSAGRCPPSPPAWGAGGEGQSWENGKGFPGGINSLPATKRWCATPHGGVGRVDPGDAEGGAGARGGHGRGKARASCSPRGT